VARVPVSTELAAHIAARIAAFPAESSEKLRWQIPYVAEFAALPLYAGWTETIGLRADGEFVSWSTEGDYIGTQSVEDQSLVISALVVGSDRYPELRSLLPVRGPGSVDCPCRAVPLCVSGQLICGTCGGLGWLSE
jgi:hypothetical protein